MAYLIVGDGGAAGFVGRAKGIPPNKPSLAAMYALAAEYFGMRFVYLEAGSGADGRVSQAMISAVRKVYAGTLIVGGGITSPEAARLSFERAELTLSSLAQCWRTVILNLCSLRYVGQYHISDA